MADALAKSFLVIVLPLFIANLSSGEALFGLSTAAATGVILATFGIANAFCQPFAGLNLVYLVADGTVDLLLIRLAQGVTVAFTVTASIALVNELSTGSSRGGNMGSYNALRLTGFGAGPLMAGFVAAFLIAGAAALLFSVAAVQPVVGTLSDRWGRTGFVFWGRLLLAPTTLAQGLTTTPVQMLVARIAQGLAGAMVFAPALALPGDHARRGQSGFQLSILTMAFGLGRSGGQLSGGFLIGIGYVAPFIFGTVPALIAAVMVRLEVVPAGT